MRRTRTPPHHERVPALSSPQVLRMLEGTLGFSAKCPRALCELHLDHTARHLDGSASRWLVGRKEERPLGLGRQPRHQATGAKESRERDEADLLGPRACKAWHSEAMVSAMACEVEHAIEKRGQWSQQRASCWSTRVNPACFKPAASDRTARRSATDLCANACGQSESAQGFTHSVSEELGPTSTVSARVVMLWEQASGPGWGVSTQASL